MPDCKDCTYFRSAPHEAAHTGCYFPANMPVKQKLACLDQQQMPGNHLVINKRGQCKDFNAKPAQPSLWERLLGKGA